MEVLVNIQQTSGLIFLVMAIYAYLDKDPYVSDSFALWFGVILLASGAVLIATTLIRIWS